jgi:hypothetical protein
VRPKKRENILKDPSKIADLSVVAPLGVLWRCQMLATRNWGR